MRKNRLSILVPSFVFALASCQTVAGSLSSSSASNSSSVSVASSSSSLSSGSSSSGSSVTNSSSSSASSSVSSSSAIDSSAAFDAFQTTLTAIVGASNQGWVGQNESVAISIYNDGSLASAVSSSSEETPVTYDLSATAQSSTLLLDGADATDASSFGASLSLQNCSYTIPNANGESVSVEKQTFNDYYKDYRLYIDTSKANTTRGTILIPLVQKLSGDSSWTMAAKSYLDLSLQQDTIDGFFPLTDNSSTIVASLCASLEQAHADYPDDVALTIPEEGAYRLEINMTDKNHLNEWIADAIEATSWTESSKKTLGDNLGFLIEATTINTFDITFDFTATSFTSVAFDVDLAFDKDELAKDFGEASSYLTSFSFVGNFTPLSGESALISYPSDLLDYTVITLPIAQ
jgi:hypothetical protein